MRASVVLASAALALLAGCPEPAKPPPPPAPAPEILAFTASPAELTAGQNVTLTWDTQYATSVEIQQAGIGAISGVSGAKGTVVVAVQEDALFVLTAKNERGVEVSAATAVQVDEPATEVLFVSTPENVDLGQGATLAWSAPGARTVTLGEKDGAAIDLGAQLEVGSVTVSPALSTTYVLTVDGLPHETTVYVRPSVGALAATPSSATPGEDLTVSWQTSGASEVTLALAGGSTLHTETDPAKVADGSFVYAVPASISPAAALTFVLTARGAQGEVTSEQRITVYVTGAPEVRVVTAPAFALTGSTYAVSWQTSGADQVELVQDGTVVYRSPTWQVADQGTATFPTPAQDVVLVVRAINLRGGVDESDPMTISPVGVPTVTSFTAMPQPGITTGGDPVTLSWNVPNARHVKIIAEGHYTVTELTGVTAETGTVTTYPNVDTTYRLEADNTIGDAITPVTVDVTVTTPAQLTLNPPTAPMGGLVQVTAHNIPNGGDILGLPTLQKNAPGAAFVDISTTGVDIDYSGPDTTAKVVTMPQPFTARIFGDMVTNDKLTISINGWFALGSTTAFVDLPYPIPTTQLVPYAIAPFFHDLIDNATGEIFYQVDTVGTEKRLIVQWDQVEFDPVAGSSMTFQAQLYEGGRIVFAYQSVQAAAGATPSIGAQNGDETIGLAADSIVPADGDTYTLFGASTVPATFKVIDGMLNVRVLIGTDHFIDITQSFPIIPPNQFSISEANLAPGVTDGQWIELVNNTANPIDLQNWVIEDGAGGSHTINQSVILPANGYAVLAQSANGADGLTVDYVYGNALTLPATAGSEINVGIASAKYAPLKLAGNVLPGHSVQVGPISTATGVIKATGATELMCTAPSTAAYGTNNQKGTPGLPNAPCPPYSYAGLSQPGAFESITATGTAVVPLGGVNESIDEIQLTVPIRFGGFTYDRLWVSTNGFISLKPLACASATNCHYVNSTSLVPTADDSGLVAPYWDDLTANSGGGIWWERKVPGLAPNDGYTIVSWEDVKYDLTSAVGSFNFQVKFFDTGDIEYHFGSMTTTSGTNYGTGTSATTWLEDPSGLAAYRVNVNSTTAPGIAANAAYRFVAQ